MRADVEKDDAAGLQREDDAVVVREPRGEVVGQVAVQLVGAQLRRPRIFYDELYRRSSFRGEVGMSFSECRKFLAEAGGREEFSPALLSSRKSAATDLCRRILPARYSSTLK